MEKRILLVDDDVQLNKIHEKILPSSGLATEVHTALNGREALDYLRARIEKGYPLPNIIIVDLEMPVMNGFEFIDAFNAMNTPGKSNIEVIVFTSSINPSDRSKALAKGVRHYLNKPYLIRALHDVFMQLKAERRGPYAHTATFSLP
ncbi:MAG TPA: response regulator [Chryseosolibacter sp.]